MLSFGSLGLIPMIQQPVRSSGVALQYETGMKFSIEWYTTSEVPAQPRGVSVRFLYVRYLVNFVESTKQVSVLYIILQWRPEGLHILWNF